MEADWEFEVGGHAPVIEAYWPGFHDLRVAPERAVDLLETAQLPGLAAALVMLNAENSPVWTSKCDFWPALKPEEFDGDELDAPPGCALHGMSCFIDMLPKVDCSWALQTQAEEVCKSLRIVLAPVPLRCCRVDLVIRRASIAADRMDMGITAYVTACGSMPSEAKASLEAALGVFARALCDSSKLQ